MLYLKNIQKIYKSHDIRLELSCHLSTFHQKLGTTVISRNADIDCILVYKLFG